MGRNKTRNRVTEIHENILYVHKPIITPSRSKRPASDAPTSAVYNITPVLEFTLDNDYVNRSMRSPGSAIGHTVAIHAHWTKSQDTDQSGKTVQWVLEWIQFDGEAGSISGATATTNFTEDTYTDNGTTNKIVYKTAPVEISGYSPNEYVSMKLYAISGGTDPIAEPALISVDVTWSEYTSRDRHTA